jgi:malate permease and related proteins
MWQLATGLFWTSVGLVIFQFLPDSLPKKFGRLLYWVGVPLQVLALAHSSDFANAPWLPPLIVVVVLVLGLLTSILCLRGLKQARSSCLEARRPQAILAADAAFLITPQTSTARFNSLLVGIFSSAWPKYRPSRGSFILSSMLGNTIFIGLAIIPSLVNPSYLGWIILYGVAHYLLGSYGVGVFLASYFGQNRQNNHWSTQCRDVLTVPALWAFAIGLMSQPIHYPDIMNWGLQMARLTGVPAVFVLLGMQLGKFRGVQGLQTALVPATIKMLVLPLVAGLGLTLFGLHGDARLTLVLMAGMPTNSANLILAEEYNLDRQLAAGSILISTIGLPLLLPLWVTIFR